MPFESLSKVSDETARFVLVIMVWVTLNWMGAAVFFLEPPSTMRDLLIALVGSISTIFVQQIQYYNKTGLLSDRQKDETINKMANVAAAANLPPAKSTGPSDESSPDRSAQ